MILVNQHVGGHQTEVAQEEQKEEDEDGAATSDVEIIDAENDTQSYPENAYDL